MGTPSPFLRWTWVRRWWNHFSDGRQLVIGVLRDPDGSPIAIAPFVLSPGTEPRRRYLRHLTWISGVGEVLGDRMDVIVPQGREDELTPRLLQCLDALQSQWDAVWLPAIPEVSPNLPHLKSAFERVGVGADEVDSYPCRFTAIPKDWSAYEEARSSRWRRNLRNRWATFTDDHAGRRGLSGRDMPHHEALDHLARLHALNWPVGKSNFLHSKAWVYHRELALDALENGTAMLVFLAAGERVVAGAYGFVERGRFSLFQQGWDPEFKDLSIGNLVVHWSLQAAADRGLHTYDMLSGDARYKAEWCPELEFTVDLETFQPESLRADLFRLLRGVSRGWKRWLTKIQSPTQLNTQD